MKRIVFVLMACIALFVAGCGPKTVTVTGTVTYKGQPAPDIAVSFEHASGAANPGPAASGKTDSGGRYQLHLLNEAKTRGVIPGDYKVFLRWVDPNVDHSLNVDKPPTNPSPYPDTAPVYGGQGVPKTVANSGGVIDFELDKPDSP